MSLALKQNEANSMPGGSYHRWFRSLLPCLLLHVWHLLSAMWRLAITVAANVCRDAYLLVSSVPLVEEEGCGAIALLQSAAEICCGLTCHSQSMLNQNTCRHTQNPWSSRHRLWTATEKEGQNTGKIRTWVSFLFVLEYKKSHDSLHETTYTCTGFSPWKYIRLVTVRAICLIVTPATLVTSRATLQGLTTPAQNHSWEVKKISLISEMTTTKKFWKVWKCSRFWDLETYLFFCGPKMFKVPRGKKIF